MRSSTLALCVCLAITSVACRKTTQESANKAQEPGAGTPKAEAPGGKTIAQAMSLYAQGFNKLIGPMKYTIGDYQREFPSEVKGAPARKPILTLGTTDRDLDEVAKAFADAKLATPANRMDLPQAADKAMAAARAVRKDFADAVRYYSAENYKDDKGQGGKAIDARMRASMEGYETSVQKLQNLLGQIELDMMESELKQVPETAPGHHFRAFNLAAKRLLETRGQADKVDAALEAVKAANVKLKKFAEGRPDILVAFKNYVGLADQFEAQAVASVREAKDPAKAKAPSQNASLLVSRYNNLVQLGNSLYDLEAQGVLK